ncbi:MAG: hypothetical protein AAF788_07300, partial [Pseudomonadota bacterium]
LSVALLTTAAVAAGSITAARALRKRFRRAQNHWDRIRRGDHAGKDEAVLDLEADENGVFGLKKGS